MGADYIATSLYCIAELDPPTEERPYAMHNFDRTLSWASGERFIKEWAATLTAEGVQAFDLYGDVYGEDLPAQRKEIEEMCLHKLSELRDSIGLGDGHSWRDIGWQQFAITGQKDVVMIEFTTGGMSHGDGPTESYDIWTWFYDEGRSEIDILSKVGFLNYQDVTMTVTLPKEKMHWLNPSIP